MVFMWCNLYVASSVKDLSRGVASTVQGWLGKAHEKSELGDGQPGGVGAVVSFALNGGERVDWQLQESEFDLAQEYVAALQAHNSYFAKADVAAFLVNEVIGRPLWE